MTILGNVNYVKLQNISCKDAPVLTPPKANKSLGLTLDPAQIRRAGTEAVIRSGAASASLSASAVCIVVGEE